MKKLLRFEKVSTMITAALNITNAFLSLHNRGYSFQDLNDDGIFIDLQNGDIRIGDCDNICWNNKSVSGILGKMGYIAPEVLSGKTNPNIGSDRYSLAVLLFMLFMRNHPLEGQRLRDIELFDDEISKKVYGEEAVFIYDPVDDSNRPCPDQSNAIKLWEYFPRYLRDAFTRAFTDGLHDPSKRLTDSDWMGVLIHLSTDLYECRCGSTAVFASGLSDRPNHVCRSCNKRSPILSIGDVRMVLEEGRAVYSWIINKDSGSDLSIGCKVSRILTGNTQVELTNCGNDIWNRDLINEVYPGESIILRAGEKVVFNKNRTALLGAHLHG